VATVFLRLHPWLHGWGGMLHKVLKSLLVGEMWQVALVPKTNRCALVPLVGVHVAGKVAGVQSI
jgi:hypothetical protein